MAALVNEVLAFGDNNFLVTPTVSVKPGWIFFFDSHAERLWIFHCFHALLPQKHKGKSESVTKQLNNFCLMKPGWGFFASVKLIVCEHFSFKLCCHNVNLSQNNSMSYNVHNLKMFLFRVRSCDPGGWIVSSTTEIQLQWKFQRKPFRFLVMAKFAVSHM